MTSSNETFIQQKIEHLEHSKRYSPFENEKGMVEGYDRDDWEEKSTGAMKKLQSVERLSLDLINTKSDLQSLKNKTAKDLKSSSSTLQKDFGDLEFDENGKKFLTEQWCGRAGSELFSYDAASMKKFALGKYISENPKTADLKWSLFCAACHSYRYDFVLRPFPPMFINRDVKDIDKLRDVAVSCPSMNVLHAQIEEKSTDMIPPDLINLLYWVLIHVREPHLKFIPKEKHNAVLTKILSTFGAMQPHYIFQVGHSRRGDGQKFNEYAKNFRVIHAFHGTRLDNFYSILNYGLKISFSKLSSNGPGIYLSNEMSVSLPYSQAGFTWGGSYFGSQISIMALCELIDHPDVKYIDDKNKKKKSKFVMDVNSIPPKYFVVTNGDLVRVKYLLIFTQSIPETPDTQISAVTSWMQRNKVIAVVMAYIILLLAIATSHNSTFYKFYKRFMRSLGYKV